jgi:hypothetical protein
MPIPDSIRFKKEAKKCETASKVATFLESYVPPSYYDFALPDLLYFSNKEALLELRGNIVWQDLEREFKAVRGLISEDWDDAEEVIPPRIVKPHMRESTPKVPKNRAVGLILATFISSAVVGGWIGWNYPYFRFPILSQQVTTPNK